MSQQSVTPELQKVKSKSGILSDLIVLKPDQELPKEILQSPGRHSVYIDGVLWTLENNALHTTFSATLQDKEAEDFLEKKYGFSPEPEADPVYKPNLTYKLVDKLKEFTFPMNEFQWTMKYFQEIYDKHKTEAAVLLMINMTEKRWKVLPVVQVDCSGGAVNYIQPVEAIQEDSKDFKAKKYLKEVLENPAAKALHESVIEEYNRLYAAGYVIYGTIHSHCNFGAFHSGVDDNDEIQFDGLHITIGNVRSGWSFAARMMLKRSSFPLNICDVLNVKDVKEITSNLDDIIVNERDMSLIMPDLGKSYLVPARQGYKIHDMSDWRNNDSWDDTDTRIEKYHDRKWNSDTNLWNTEEDTEKKEWEKKGLKDYDDNVFEAADMVILRGKGSGKIIYVTYQYYISKKNAIFSDHAFERLNGQKAQKIIKGEQTLLLNNAKLDKDWSKGPKLLNSFRLSGGKKGKKMKGSKR